VEVNDKLHAPAALPADNEPPISFLGCFIGLKLV